MNTITSIIFIVNCISLLGLMFLHTTNAQGGEKCYSCSSANFEQRWPKDKNSTLLYLTNFAFISNESCDGIRGPLPVVPCPDSVCVKFVVQESSSTRAVCSSSLSPIIVRDCWSRVVHSTNASLQLKPFQHKPVKLAPLPGKEKGKSIGQIFTCTGYLCNGSEWKSGNIAQIAFIITSIYSITLL